MGEEVATLSHDPVVQTFRGQISELDLQILAALNTRIGLVQRLKEHKATLGLDFYDAAQEDRVLASLCQANRGPLPDDGLTDIFRLILAWTKRAAGPGQAG